MHSAPVRACEPGAQVAASVVALHRFCIAILPFIFTCSISHGAHNRCSQVVLVAGTHKLVLTAGAHWLHVSAAAHQFKRPILCLKNLNRKQLTSK